MYFEGCNPDVRALFRGMAQPAHTVAPMPGLDADGPDLFSPGPIPMRQRFATIILRGASTTELVALKQALQLLLYCGQAIYLESSLMSDQFTEARPAGPPPQSEVRAV